MGGVGCWRGAVVKSGRGRVLERCSQEGWEGWGIGEVKLGRVG